MMEGGTACGVEMVRSCDGDDRMYRHRSVVPNTISDSSCQSPGMSTGVVDSSGGNPVRQDTVTGSLSGGGEKTSRRRKNIFLPGGRGDGKRNKTGGADLAGGHCGSTTVHAHESSGTRRMDETGQYSGVPGCGDAALHHRSLVTAFADEY